MNNNLSVTYVNIGDRVLTIIGETEDLDLVKTAGAGVNKYFNVVPEESKSEEADP